MTTPQSPSLFYPSLTQTRDSRHSVGASGMSSMRVMSFSGEIHYFADHLEARNFKALSQGLGLGHVRPVKFQTAPAPATASAAIGSAEAQQAMAARQNQADYIPVQKLSSSSRNTRTPASSSSSWERFFMAWSLDFLVVVGSLVFVLAAACAVVISRQGMPTTPLQLAPVHWLGSLSPVKVLMSVYAIFIVYAVIFRTVAGRTIGESWLGLVRKANDHVTRENTVNEPHI